MEAVDEAVQGFALDAEDLGGLGLVAVGGSEDLLDLFGLGVFEGLDGGVAAFGVGDGFADGGLINTALRGEDDEAFHHVLELADVAGPGVGVEGGEAGLGGDGLAGVAFVVAVLELLDEEGEVSGALA